MELASKKRIERKKQNQIVDTNSNTYGVVITVYTESLTARSRRISEDPTKKTKALPHFRSHGTAGTRGYDRRALLLAHSQKLRNAASQNVPLLTNQPRPKTKSKGIWLTQPVRICSSSSPNQVPPSSSSCGNERVAFEENKERNSNGSLFLSKMKNLLKMLSCKEIWW